VQAKEITMKSVTKIVVLLLAAISIQHLLRLIFRWEVIVNGITIKLWLSIFGCIVPAALAVLLWLENKDD
jgi:membrane protein CcdC involved in cytochrome C biogenesis